MSGLDVLADWRAGHITADDIAADPEVDDALLTVGELLTPGELRTLMAAHARAARQAFEDASVLAQLAAERVP